MPRTITIPADLAEIIATHRALFGGFTMMADEDKGGDADSKPDGEQPDGFKSEESKQKVLADLHTERTKRQDLERRVSELAPLKEQFERLQAAFGPQKNDDDGKGGTPDAFAEINRRLDEADLKAEVERLARVHRITEDTDVALLASVKDASAREALAKRIAPSENSGTDGARRPKPDPSVGRSGGDGNRSTSVDSGRSLYADTHKTKTTP